MIVPCDRCKDRPEYSEGAKTGGGTGRHRTLRKQINDSGVLAFHGCKGLCNDCMEEFLRWLKNANTQVRFKLPAITRKK
jgi:hypothetical protein